jgi:hypothetical protein
VTYHNLSGGDLLPGVKPKRITLSLSDGQHYTIHGAVIPPPYADLVRTGTVSRIEQTYE